MSYADRPIQEILLPLLRSKNLVDPPSITVLDVDTSANLIIKTSAARVYTLPTPTRDFLPRLIYIVHDDDSTGSLDVNGVSISIGSHIAFLWDGDLWHVQEVTGVSTGISIAQHRGLDQLVHRIAETSFEEITRSGNLVTDVIVWVDNSKLVKIRETNITYTGNQATTVVTKQYDGLGVLVETLTETLSYTGNNLDDIDRVLT